MDWLGEDVEWLLGAGASPMGPVLEDLEERASTADVPTIGPDAGRICRLLTGCLQAERVFEFGSGFGYSAAWIAPAMAPGGELVCTEYDAGKLDRARTTLDRVEHDVTTRFVHGDAMAAFGETSGTFDVVLLDHEKERYAEAFDAVARRVTTPGIVVADNVLDGPTDPASIRAGLEGGTDDSTARGIANYLQRVRSADGYETAIVPVGEGLAISRRW